MKNSLSKTGLSLSQAQSVSNLCNQASVEIQSKLDAVNNCSKTITINDKTFTQVEAVKLPSNVKELLLDKAKYSACQAFLIENIKAKSNLIDSIKSEEFPYDTMGECPKYPELVDFKPQPTVDESWGWSQLTPSEYNEYLAVSSYAAHIGQFIHKGGKLDSLRKELPKLPSLDWFEVKQGEKTPVQIDKHHTSDELHQLHIELSMLHREYEQKVNYYKAKVKNLVSIKNSEIEMNNKLEYDKIEKQNQSILEKYKMDISSYRDKVSSAKAEFESKRHSRLKEASEMRILVDSRFQDVINKFLVNISEA